MAEKKYLTIDGLPVAINGEKNLLELIRKIGIELPTFCYHSDLSVHGACRMCMVENEWGGLDAACSTPPRAGMNIRTNTERLRRYRKNILELLLASHCRDCTICEKSGRCKLQSLAVSFNIDRIRFGDLPPQPGEDDTSSPCIARTPGKCILCGDCVRMCNEVQNVGAIDFAFRGSKMVIATPFGIPLSESTCVGCGQCAAVCPTGAIVVKNDIERVWKAIDDPEVETSVQVAPAVRVGIGRELGLKDGENAMGRIVAALRRMGFTKIHDTTVGADLTILEEATEFLERLDANRNLPLLTSCCPGWVQYCEKKHPEFLHNISTCRSPMQMFASVLKAPGVLKQPDGAVPRRQFHVAVMPCTAKKFEAARDEFKVDGVPNVDAVLTTQELIRMIRESGIAFETLEPEAVDNPFGTISGAGVIFGVTGGVTEAVLRHVVANKTHAGLSVVAEIGQRGEDGVKEFTLQLGERRLHAAVVSGLGNAEKILARVTAGEHFDFIEVMACPGGCVCGGGQPVAEDAERSARSRGLYDVDRVMSIRRAEENPVMATLYAGPLCGREHELLHVEYGTGRRRH